ncbi:MAG: helix-turn-helix transcriptional regulator [Coriobacteriaceae bacterium]|nr:helix-turn-helix transcriptional regulator [Coriobacteriaceae bacterium]
MLAACSSATSPRSFVELLTSFFADAFGYDDVIALFYDAAGTIVAFHTQGTKREWLEIYLSYYSDLAETIYQDSVDSNALVIEEHLSEKPPLYINMYDWTRFKDSPFKRNYLDARGLKSTLAFNLCDLNGIWRVAICLDRMKTAERSKRALEALRLALPILNSMYRNYYYKETDDGGGSPWESYGLTAREVEIADMLCRCMKAERIGDELFIARTTVRKHIAHIYEKVGVSSQSELIVRAAEHRMVF